MRRCLRCHGERRCFYGFCMLCLVQSAHARKKAGKRWRKGWQPDMRGQPRW